jgi:lysophospholipase L1-like esterase
VSHPISNRSDLQPGGSPARRKRPIVAGVVFVVALLFTIVGTVETLFILYDRLAGGSLSAERAPDLGLGIRSWTEHHAMRPGFDVPPTRTNSFGLRSPEVAIPKPRNTFRILLLGDSFTFGFKSAEDDVFARKLEGRLRREYGATTVEVVNAGVLSYCPLLEDLQYRHHLHILEPDLVILNFDMSDVQDHMDYSRSTVFAADGAPLFVSEPTLRTTPGWAPGLLSWQWVSRHASALSRRFESTSGGMSVTHDRDRYAWALDGGPEWDDEVKASLAPVADLAQLLEHYGIAFVLATYPQPWQVAADATPRPPIRTQFGIGLNTVHLNDRSFRKLAAFAETHGIPFVNATDAFRKEGKPADLFLPADFHFSPLGNQRYADVLAAYIISHSAIGERFPSTRGR